VARDHFAPDKETETLPLLMEDRDCFGQSRAQAVIMVG
jgi:hypothetical protein